MRTTRKWDQMRKASNFIALQSYTTSTKTQTQQYQNFFIQRHDLNISFKTNNVLSKWRGNTNL